MLFILQQNNVHIESLEGATRAVESIKKDSLEAEFQLYSVFILVIS